MKSKVVVWGLFGLYALFVVPLGIAWMKLALDEGSGQVVWPFYWSVFVFFLGSVAAVSPLPIAFGIGTYFEQLRTEKS